MIKLKTSASSTIMRICTCFHAIHHLFHRCHFKKTRGAGGTCFGWARPQIHCWHQSTAHTRKRENKWNADCGVFLGGAWKKTHCFSTVSSPKKPLVSWPAGSKKYLKIVLSWLYHSGNWRSRTSTVGARSHMASSAKQVTNKWKVLISTNAFHSFEQFVDILHT